MEEIGVKDIIKKVLEFVLGFISAVIIIRLTMALRALWGIDVYKFISVCILTTVVAAILIIRKKTRFFGAGLFIPAGFFSFVYFILYLLFKDGFP